MQSDPMEEWRRLTALYSEMGDLEIRELASQINDLTETAQQILRDELKKRGISERSSTQTTRPSVGNSVAVHWDDREDSENDIDPDRLERAATEYTWKTGLCRCESIDEAAQRAEMLRRAGIESWIQRPGSRYPIPWVGEFMTGDIQINVAADQLEGARAIAERPIPQDIIDQLEEEAGSDYEVPKCPRCGAEDPTLESVESSNNWLCESCGHVWSDPIPDTAT